LGRCVGWCASCGDKQVGVTAIYNRSTGEPEIEHALRLWGSRLHEILSGQEPVSNVVSIR
jgi:hypothetical protein